MANRAVWIDAGNDADYAKLRAHGIDSPYFDIRDSRVTRAYLEGVQAEGFAPGVYAAWNWYPTLGGAGFAVQLSGLLVGLGAPPGFPKVCADIEIHDVGYILAFLKRWRKLRPMRVTDWTLEGFQGGLFTANDTLAIAAANVGVIPQTYTGSMEPQDVARVVLDLAFHSFPPARISPFYDAARLPAEWSGYAFAQGRLP